jgi:hypothetical protein
MTFASLDSKFWLVNYQKIDLFITLGRDVAPHPSPRAPTTSPRLTYNPGCTDGVLSVPADRVDKETFTSLVAPYRPKRVVLIEYVLVHPDQTASLLLRLESNGKFAHELFCTDRKIRKLMAELRSTLSTLGALPRRPDDWFDPLPSHNPALRVERAFAKAREVAAVAQRMARQQSSRVQLLEQAIQAARDQPADHDLALRLSRLVNRRVPGNPARSD